MSITNEDILSAMIEMQMQITELNRKHTELMSTQVSLLEAIEDNKKKITEAIECLRTPLVAMEMRMMWAHVEDDEMVRQICNAFDSWNCESDETYFVRRVRYCQFKWLLSRSREASDQLRRQLERVWKYLMSVVMVYLEEQRKSFLRESTNRESDEASRRWWASTLVTHEKNEDIHEGRESIATS